MTLELDDIQHFLLTRPHALAARYEFISFPSTAAGRAWLATILEKVGSGATVNASDPSTRWVTVAFTWNGLRALGVDDADLATFPEEFRQGMAARAAVLGLTGANAPEHWVGGLASAELHAIDPRGPRGGLDEALGQVVRLDAPNAAVGGLRRAVGKDPTHRDVRGRDAIGPAEGRREVVHHDPDAAAREVGAVAPVDLDAERAQ